ncbi:MAG TPA: hypothetical protein DCQ46_04870 [Lachnospiraceae bacterium]|nr:hypothetical protein [Lachnospiraceae bacterium]
MKTVGVVAEFNPFHNGHEYFLREAKRLANADYLICAMSPDFVQRGEMAVISEKRRAKAALLAGADVVVAMPLHFSTAAAEIFAEGGINTLLSTRAVDSLCFGVENVDYEGEGVGILRRAAELLCNETDSFKECLKEKLKDGATYPAAVSMAVAKELGEKYADAFSTPNSALGCFYFKALIKASSKVLNEVSAVKRSTEPQMKSATQIREDIGNSKEYVPEYASDLSNALTLKDFDEMLEAKLIEDFFGREDFIKELIKYQDMGEELARRIYREKNGRMDFSTLLPILKTRNVTYAHVSRALLHVLLGIKESEVEAFRRSFYEKGGYPYLRVLGFKKSAASVMKKMNEESRSEIIMNLSECENSSFFKTDMYGKLLYDRVYARKYSEKPEYEFAGPVIL